MTTLNDVIGRAYREQQILDINVAPSTEQVTEALPLLQGIILRNLIQTPQSTIWIGASPKTGKARGQRNFTDLRDTYALPQNVYVHASLSGPLTLFMPYDAGDGARLVIVDAGGSFSANPLTLDGNRGLIDGSPTAVLSSSGQRADFFYRRDLAEWRSVSPLTAVSTVPFPEEYDDMFTIELAARLMVRYGKALDEATASLYKTMQDRFKARYSRTASDVEADVLFASEYAAFDTSGGVTDSFATFNGRN